MSHRLTLLCDCCGKEWMIEEDIDLPPYWFGVQIAIADKEGLIPQHERDIYIHFCSQQCFAEYVESKVLRERILMVDKQDVPEASANNDDEDDHAH